MTSEEMKEVIYITVAILCDMLEIHEVAALYINTTGLREGERLIHRKRGNKNV